MTEHHEPMTHEHVSRVDAPCLLHGTIGVCIGLLMQVIGLFQGGDDRLMALFLDPVFQGEMPKVISVPILGGVAAVFSYAVAFFVLDTSGMARRVMLGVTVLVLVLAIQPTLAVWGFYFSPFFPVVAVFWSWFLSVMYTNHHLMPCDVDLVDSLEPKVVEVPVVENEEKGEAVPEKIDPNEKYKPKDSQKVKEEDLKKEVADG